MVVLARGPNTPRQRGGFFTPRVMKAILCLARLKLVPQILLPILFLQLLVFCGTQDPKEKSIEVRFREITVEPTAVSKVLPLVAPSRQPDEANLSPALQSLFTYLAQADPDDLVTTKPHSQGKWRIEKVFLLDDCVAVEMSEGHYLETLFFVQHSKGWRLTARISPRDHE